MKFKSILAVALLLAGCAPDPDTPMGAYPALPGRIQIVRVGIIKDDIAYHERRGIYIITDTKTGKEYIGVSGIGISETGSRNAGKTVISDER